jgi:hypothetical protein
MMLRAASGKKKETPFGGYIGDGLFYYGQDIQTNTTFSLAEQNSMEYTLFGVTDTFYNNSNTWQRLATLTPKEQTSNDTYDITFMQMGWSGSRWFYVDQNGTYLITLTKTASSPFCMFAITRTADKKYRIFSDGTFSGSATTVMDAESYDFPTVIITPVSANSNASKQPVTPYREAFMYNRVLTDSEILTNYNVWLAKGGNFA